MLIDEGSRLVWAATPTASTPPATAAITDAAIILPFDELCIRTSLPDTWNQALGPLHVSTIGLPQLGSQDPLLAEQTPGEADQGGESGRGKREPAAEHQPEAR